MRKHSPALALFRKHLRVPVTALLLSTVGMWSNQVKGATLSWDSDFIGVNNVATGAGLGGLGTWNTTGSNWWNGTNLSPASLSAWNNAGNDTALFTGTAGVITLGTGVTVGGLQFNTTGYTLGAATNTNAISFGTSGNIVLNNVAAATINGPLQGGAGNNITLTGGVFGGVTAGTLTLQGTAAAASLTGYSGSTTINNGMTMSLAQNNQALSATSGITLNNGNILIANAANATEAGLSRVSGGTITSNGGSFTWTNAASNTISYAEAIGTVDLVSGRLTFTNTNANTSPSTQVLTLGGLTRTGATNVSTVNFTGASLGANAQNRILITGQAVGDIGPWATHGSNSFAAYDATNGVIASTTTTLAVASNSATTNFNSNGANITVTSGTNPSYKTLQINSTTARTITGTGNTISVGGIVTTGATHVITGGSVRALTAGAPLYVHVPGNQLDISSAIVDNTTAGGLVLSGPGTLRLLTGTNTFGGNITINSGTLSVDTDARLGAVTNDIVFNGSGSLSITAATQTLGTGRDIQLNNTSIATLNTTNASVTTIQGIISGNGGITATPIIAGTLTLSGANTYTGPTNANTGTLKAGSTSAFGNGSAVTLANTAGVLVDITGFNNSIGSLSGGGTSGGSVILGSATLTVGSNNENTTFSGTIINANSAAGGAGVLTKTGTGILTLPTSTRSAATTAVSAASTTLTAPTAGFGPGMAVVGVGIPAGTTIVSITNSTSMVLSNPVTVASGQTINFGGNGYSGGTNLNGGLVNIANVAAFGSGTLTLDGGGIQWNPNNTVFAEATNDISTRTVTINAGGATLDTNNSQVILDNAIGNSGTGGLTKAGNGTLILRGANTYSGATTVRNGVLRLENNQALGTGSVTTVQNGASLTLAGGITTGGAGFGGTLTLNGNGALAGQIGALVNTAGNNTYAGDVVLGSSSTIAADNGSLALTGTGVSGTGDLTLAGASNGVIIGNLTHTGGLVKTGAGNWEIDGTSSTYAGTTTVSNGILQFFGGALGSTSGTTLGSATLRLLGGSQNIGGLTLSANTASNVIADAGTTLTTGSITRNAGATAKFDLTGAGSSLPTSATGSGTNNLLGWSSVTDSAGTGIGYVNGGLIQRFNATASGTMLTVSSDSATTDFHTNGISSPLAWDNSGALTARSVNSLTFDTSGGAQTVHMGAAGNVLTISSGALGFTGANNGTLLGGQVGANNSEVIVHQNGAGVLAINSPISGGTGSLIKLGTGTLQVSGGISTSSATLNGTTTVTVPSTAGLAVGQAVSGGGIAPGTTIASIVNGTDITLSSPATTGLVATPFTSALTFGSGSSYTGSTQILGGTLQAGSSSIITPGAVVANVAGYQTYTGGPVGPNSAVTLANTAGTSLDVNGNAVVIGSLAGGGATGGNINLSNGGTLVVGGGNLIQNLSATPTATTFGGQITGNGNLVLTGGSNLVLTNNTNNFTGQVNINSGTLVVSNQAQLGSGTSPVFINGIASGSLNNTALPAGMLILQGGASGMTFSRDIVLAGRGNNTQGLGLLNIGNNTYSGNLSFNGTSDGRIGSSYGTMTLSGTVTAGSDQRLFITGGPGNVVLSGLLTGGVYGTSGVNKASRGGLNNTLILTNTANDFIGDFRADSGTILITNPAVLGSATSRTKLRGNGGTFEIRTDLGASFAPYAIGQTDGNHTLFVDRGIGSLGASTLNQTVTFGALTQANSRTTTFTGRNGTNVVVNSFLSNGAGNASDGLTVTANGTTTFNAGNVPFWGETDNTGGRTYTLTTTGDTFMNGRITASGTFHDVTKAGAGSLTLDNATGSTSTFTGRLNLNAGTLNVGTANLTNTINNVAGTSSGILLNGGTLNVTGTAGATLSKTLVLNAGNSIVTANQTGGGLLVANNVGVTLNTARTLVLGGNSTQVNTIQQAITNMELTTNVQKIGNGTWQLDTPTQFGTANPALTITAVGGTASGIITASSTSGLVVGQPVSGTGFTFGTTITEIISGTQFRISKNAVSTGTTANVGTVNGPASIAVTANTGNTLTVGSTANLVPGQPISSTSLPAGQGWYIASIASATTFTIANTTGTAAIANSAAVATQTLASSPNYGGTLSIGGGLVNVNPSSGTAEVINNSAGLTFNTDALTLNGNAGGTFRYSAFSSGSSETMGVLTSTSGLGKIELVQGTSGTSTLTFGTLGARTAGGVLNYNPAAGGGAGASGIQFLVSPTGQASSGALTGAYITNGTAIDFVATPGATTNIAALNAATAFPTATGGAANNYLLSSSTTTTAAVAANTVRITSGANLTLGTGNLTITSTSAAVGGGILHDNSGGASTISGQSIAVSTANQELIIITGGSNNANALTISSVLANGTGQVTKAGAGTLILSGQNTFSGALNILEGTVKASGTNTQILGNPNATAATFHNLRQNGTLDINAAGAVVAPYTGATALPTLVTAPVQGSGTITTTASGSQAIQFGTAATTAVANLSSVLGNGSGVLTVIKQGAAASNQILSGLNTYTGPTIISGGILQATSLANGGSPSSIGQSSNAAANLVFNGGILLYQGSNANVQIPTQTPSIAIDRNFTLAGNGTIDSTGSFGNNVVAAAAGNNAALIFNGSGTPQLAGAVGLKTLTLQGGSTGDNEMGMALTDNNGSTLGLSKAGTGLWILSNAGNTYSGPTTITGGALRVSANAANLSTSSNLRLGGGVLETSGSFTRAIGSAAGEVRWTDAAGTALNTNGGFAASTAPLTVNFGGANAQVSFGVGGIGNGIGALILNSGSALSDVTVTNPINLSGGVRTVQVDDNGTTFTDYATLSGVISGGSGSGLNKTGGGTLYLTGANTYSGNTTLSAGSLLVMSIGGGSTPSSNLGDGTGILGLNGGYLVYAGAGETVNRQINLTASSTLESSGSGPLVINNFVNASAGAKTLNLSGFNNDTNIINSNLTDSGGALTVTKNDGGVWVLAGTNTYTGNTNINSGFLGLGGTTMGGAGTPTGTIVVSNAGLFATNPAGLTISNPMTIASNTSVTFTGTNSITYNGNIAGATGNPWQIANTISGGTLTINGNVNNNETGTGRTFTFQGTGNTILNGNMTSSGGAVGLGVNTSGTFTIGGAVAAGALHTSSTITQGRVIVNKAGNLNPFGSNSVLNFGGGSIESNFALTGANAITNALQLTNIYGVFTGTNNIEFVGNATSGSFENNGGDRRVTNNLTGGASLTFSTNTFDLSNDNTARTATLQGTGTYNISAQITNGGTGASALTYSGNGALNITGTSPGGATATTWNGAVNLNGGTTTISGAGTLGSTALVTASDGATLTLDNSGTNTANRLGGRAVTLNGATLSLVGNAGAATSETVGNLITGGGQTTINLTNNGQNLALGFGTLAINTGAYINFTSNAPLGTTANRVTFGTAPTLAHRHRWPPKPRDHQRDGVRHL